MISTPALPSRRLGLLVPVLAVAAAPAVAQRPTLPVFEDGQAQVVEGFADRKSWIQHELWVETEFDSDGDGVLDRMHVDVTRPAQTETEGLKVPVIYETSPYFSGTGTTDKQYFWSPSQELGDAPPLRSAMPAVKQRVRRPVQSKSQLSRWVPRGFAVVHSASPGTGLSDGCPTVGAANESLAPKAVIDWLNGRALGFSAPVGGEEVTADWCTGKVGMTGTSYNGTLPIAAATTGVEGLEAIIPIAANTSYYHYYRSNGLVRHPGGYMGEDVDVLYDFINSGDPDRRDWCNEHVRDGLMVARQDRATGDYNDFWAGRDYANALDGIRAATFLAHGLNDWNVMPAHSIRVYAALQARGVPVRLYLHQGGHGGGPPVEEMNRWFTRYLYGVENGVEDDPLSLVVREGEERSSPTPYAVWPHPESAPVTLLPRAGGAGVGELLTGAASGQGTESLVDDVEQSGAALAAAARSRHRLLYATPELTRPVHVSGTPRLRIRVAADAPAANLSIWVVSLPWTDGGDTNSNVITRGWADPQNHASLDESQPLEPGRFYDLEFDLQPDDQIVPAGARIGLMVFASDRDFTLWPEAGTRLTVDLGATALELPVVGGPEALEHAVATGG